MMINNRFLPVHVFDSYENKRYIFYFVWRHIIIYLLNTYFII